MKIDKVLYQIVVHEFGHSICCILRGYKPYIEIKSDYCRIDGQTICKECSFNAVVVVAGYVMESIVFDRRVIRHRGTDADKLKGISKYHLSLFEDMARKELLPYKDKVISYSKQIASTSFVNDKIIISYDNIKSEMKL